jgi:hypothetical protein
MTSPLASIGFARGNDPHGATARFVARDEQPGADPGVSSRIEDLVALDWR